MACGLPIIATPETGCENIIENGTTGLIVPKNGDGSLQDAILQFYNDRELCLEMGKAASNHVQNGFGWDDYGRNYIQHLENILK